MVSFIDEHRVDHGVEPICKQLPIAPSTYYARKSLEREPERASCIAFEFAYTGNICPSPAVGKLRGLNREDYPVSSCAACLLNRLG